MFSVNGILTIVEIVFGLGMVIFVHELGHFLVAKWCKVRVEAFSLGFGPAILSFRHGETDYKVCWLPLGGYVKMAGEAYGEHDPSDSTHFANKSVGQRSAIFVAGVVMNVLFGLAVFILAFRIGVVFKEPRIEVVKGQEAWTEGLQDGDLVTHIDGDPVASFDDLLMSVAFCEADEGLDLTIQRDGKEIDFHLNPRYDENRGLQWIGVSPTYTRTIAVRSGSAAARAGLEDGDLLVSVDGRPIERIRDIERVLYRSDKLQSSYSVEVDRAGQRMSFSLELDLVRKRKIGILHGDRDVKKVAPGSQADLEGIRPGDRLVQVDDDREPSFNNLRRRWLREIGEDSIGNTQKLVFSRNRPDSEPVVISLEYGAEEGLAFLEGVLSLDDEVRVGWILPDYPSSAFLRAGDIITALDGETVEGWTGFLEMVTANQDRKSLELTWKRGEETFTAEIPTQEIDVLESDPGIQARPKLTDPRRYSLRDSCVLGWRHSIDNLHYVLLTLSGIFRGKVSARNLGGPIAIAQASYYFSQLGFGRFIYFLGLLSINLAIINLLPIPILDGAHLVFCGIEKIQGRPLSVGAQVKLNYVGFLMIILLMLFVFTNDLLRVWNYFTG